MTRRGAGVLLDNASICATRPLWYEPIYNTTEAALVILSKNLANQFIPHKIRVNAVDLGFVLTPDWTKAATQLTEGTGRTWQACIAALAAGRAPIRRFASPKEVASFFVFLCSDKASYSVGSTHNVDGGMLRKIARGGTRRQARNDALANVQTRSNYHGARSVLLHHGGPPSLLWTGMR